MKKSFIAIAIIIIGLIVVETTVLKDKTAGSLPVGIEIGDKAPAFKLNTLNGEEVSLEQFRGKKVFLNFWASWCGPCKAEMPDMNSLYQELKDDNTVILGVNLTTSEFKKSDVKTFVEDFQLTFPILLDEAGEVGNVYQILSIPTSFFIDADGVIRDKVVGTLNKDYMYDAISKLP